jgi:hypothetical protein
MSSHQRFEARTGLKPAIVDDTQDAAGSALEALTESPLVAVVGGDGTVRHAAGILAGSRSHWPSCRPGPATPLRPASGSAALRSGVDAIRAGAPRTIDLGMAEWGRGGRDHAGRTRPIRRGGRDGSGRTDHGHGRW